MCSLSFSTFTDSAFTFPFVQPENILLYRKGNLDIKIADFGLSVQVKEGQEMKTLVGTAEYVCKYSPLQLTEGDWGGGWGGDIIWVGHIGIMSVKLCSFVK